MKSILGEYLLEIFKINIQIDQKYTRGMFSHQESREGGNICSPDISTVCHGDRAIACSNAEKDAAENITFRHTWKVINTSRKLHIFASCDVLVVGFWTSIL